jgi:hypothetical protein
MCATRDGGFMIAGSIDWGDSARAWLVKTDANCDTMWTRAVGGPWRENAADIEQTADGGYIIAGTSEVSGGRMLAIKTDSLGRVGVEEGRPGVPARAAFSVTPNPCHSSTTISCSSSLLSPHSSLSLYDVTGRLVLVPRSSFFVPRSSSFRLDLRSMPAGVYLVKLDYEGGSATRKLVVE